MDPVRWRASRSPRCCTRTISSRGWPLFTGVAFRSGTSVTAHWRVRHADGSWHDVEVIATNLLGDETVEGIVLTMRDVSERRSLEEELKHQAFHDGLSGLANRALFSDRLEHALEPAPPGRRPRWPCSSSTSMISRS